jgi:DNA-binding GntR family transcriptional regulator
VYNALKKSIMMGEFEPGQKLKLADLAEVFGTSHMPVREALGRLATAGALEWAQRRSMAVPPADAGRLQSILSLRLDLEEKAVRLALARKSPGLLDRLLHANQVMDEEAASPTPRIRIYLAANHDFHFSLYSASGNADLVDLIEILWMRYGPLLNLLRKADAPFFWHGHHADLINAIRADDTEAAVAALQADLRDAATLISQQLEGETG